MLNADTYPYIISNNKIEPILAKIRSAAKPERFSTRESLVKWGFAASNDRAMVGVLKALGFINENGTPTEYYDRLRDPNDWRFVLGERMRDLYSDLFAIDTNMHSAPENEIKGAISRVTGKDDESVKRYYATFKTLAGLAKFDAKPSRATKAENVDREEGKGDEPATKRAPDQRGGESETRRRPDFHYNIQIHLPVTTDVTVYNAIFRSLRENLSI
jgi:hypothetical protein